MPFDPSQPFSVITPAPPPAASDQSAPAFDPTRPFQVQKPAAPIPTVTVRPTQPGAAPTSAPPTQALPPPAPGQQPMSALDRFGTGMKDPFVGAAQLGAHMLPGDASKQMDQYVRQRESDIEATTPNPDRTSTTLDAQGRASHNNLGKASGADPVRLMGQVTNPVPIAAAGVGGPMAGAVLSGALSGAMQPVTQTNNFWKQKAQQTAVGAGAGGLMGLGGKVLGGAIAPQFRADAQKLLDAGVDLTPGQMAGGLGRHLEEGGKSIPIGGNFIRGAELRTVDSFNRATVNQALKPIGVEVSKNLSGRELIAAGQDELNKAYNKLLPTLTFHADNDFVNSLSGLDATAKSLAMPPAQQQQWEKILNERFIDRLDPAGKMDGERLKQVDSELSRFADNYGKSTDAAQRDVGFMVRQLRGEIRDALERQDPSKTGELQKINTAYAAFTRIEAAANSAPTQEGRFTPGQLLAASKAGDASTRRRSFARGDALMQEWGQSAQNVIGNKLPDSGTAGRLGARELVEGAVGGYIDPRIAMGMAAPVLPYSKAATQGLNWYVQNQAPWRAALGGAVRGVARGAGPAAPLTADQIRQQLGIQDPQQGAR